MPIVNRDYYGASQRGREDRQNAAYADQRNMLGQMEVERVQKLNQLGNNPNATAEQYARLGRTDVANYMVGRENAQAEKVRAFAEQMANAAKYASQAQPGQTKSFIERNFPLLVETYGPGWAAASDDQVRQELQGIAAKYGVQAGIAAPSAPVQYEEIKGPRGSIIQRNTATGEQRQVVGPDNSQPSATASARFRAMSPAEIQSYNLPAGSAAQINDATGQIQVLNKPSVAPQQTAAERKSVLEAKVKLPRVSAAIRRAERLDQAIQGIAKNTFSDGGPADAKILQYTKDGREVLAAAAQLMPELQALTRVPGIGSQSDLEARLASLALPSLEFDPETNARSMAELHAFIQDLKAAYETIASGGSQTTDVPDEAGPVAAPRPAAPSPQGWSIKPL